MTTRGAVALVLFCLTAEPFQQPRSATPVAGQVVDAVGSAVADVDVRAVDVETSVLRSARTDADGRFALSLPPGRFEITATREGFLPGRFGAVAVGEPGVPIRIAEGPAVPHVAITLERFASIGGRVIDDSGDPLQGTVQALDASLAGPDQPSRRVAVTRTDAEGRYSLTGLTPGSYLVLVTPDGLPAASEPVEPRADEPLSGTVPTFHPGASTGQQANPVVVQAGEELPGVDIVVRPVPVTSVEITLAGSGQPLQFLSALLIPEGAGEVGLQTVASPDGTDFGFQSVPAGRFTLIASALEARADGVLERLWAREPVDVDGRTPVKRSIGLAPGATMTGRVGLESGGAIRNGLSDTWLRSQNELQPTGALPFGGTLDRTPGGSFSLSGIAPGRYVLQVGAGVRAQAEDVRLSQVLIAGADVTDLPIELRPSEVLQDVVISITSRLGELRGTLTDSEGRPRYDVTIVAFAADSRYWWRGTRRIRAARPDTAGEYVVADLPGGEYLVAAFAGPLPSDVADGTWLSGLAPHAVPVTVENGSTTLQNLRIR